jgi:hypothetical protein
MNVFLVFSDLVLAVAIAAICLCLAVTLSPRPTWQAQYFEAGSNSPYHSETFRSRASLEDAVMLFSRLGGDDVLKIIGPGFET